MVHRAGRLTCRAPRPGPQACRQGPERLRTLLLGPGPASTPGVALPGGERNARLPAARGGSAGADGAWRLPPALPRHPRAFISSAPARPPACPPSAACPPPRCLDGQARRHPSTPPAPRARATRQPSGGDWRAATETLTPMGLALPRGARGRGQGALLSRRPGVSAKERLPSTWLPGQHPTRNGAPRGRSDFPFAATDLRTQRPLGTVCRLGAPAQRSSWGRCPPPPPALQ